ncbi:LysR substrate-binding domain-containing protein [Montanilutibacter psychrotolerans]|uniref:LysR family transcriptional regulator n=1 Tax=Montanilutibacter psychrotolerans TaxID=1327343 RepID=A0A3M8SPB9_9GAMM|nr:LysR substrate-binding domain-containing protein [Lysobacter psychrotolerans]RNF82623.1 LysR family transcriptional regulator [Lysobacter psychrotolerans]
MLNLNDLVYFVAAVEQNGFAAASRRLGIPKSTISKRVAMLEDELAARLIHRTSRSFVLTELGRDFFEHAHAALIEAEAAEAIVRRRQSEPSGTVRMTASIPVAQLYLAELLPQLARLHPKLQLHLDVADRFVDVHQEGIDIAVRSHFAPLPDSGLVQRQLMVEPIILVASPAYLEQRKTPQSPADLQHHEGLLTNATTPTWTLFDVSGGQAQVSPRVAMIANESTVLLGAAAAGLGMTCLPERMCRELIESGKLEHVLPEWNAGSVTTTLVMPHRRGQLPSVRATVEFLVERFREMR